MLYGVTTDISSPSMWNMPLIQLGYFVVYCQNFHSSLDTNSNAGDTVSCLLISFFDNFVSVLLITEHGFTILEDIEEVMGGLYSSESKNPLWYS